MKSIFITGGTGSWGNELVAQLLKKYPEIKEIRIYSRSEHKQVDMKQKFSSSDKLRFIIGDVRDKNILKYAMSGIDTVIHLAALKHVPVCEENTWEAILTNIIGTQNVIEAAIANKVGLVVDVSTDKAVDPFNLYGVTKACGEKLIINANANYSFRSSNISTKFVCVRGGNVLGTNGSVIPLFKKQIQESNLITITDPTMTRYLMSTSEAIGLLLTAMEKTEGGELFVMKMPGTTVDIMGKTMVKLFGNKQTKIKTIGQRQGEKKHEILISRNESPYTYVFSDKYYLIQPRKNQQNIKKAKKITLKPVSFSEFTSQNTDQLSVEKLESMLRKEAWI